MSKTKAVTAQEAVKAIKSEDKVFIHSVAAAPEILLNALTDRADELKMYSFINCIRREKLDMHNPCFVILFL